eukprot:g4812.t2
MRWLRLKDEEEPNDTEPMLTDNLTFGSFTHPTPLRVSSQTSASPRAIHEEYATSPFFQASTELPASEVAVNLEGGEPSINTTPSVHEFIEGSDDFIVSLRDIAATRLGSFTIPDSEAARIFGKNKTMLTRGSSIHDDLNWKENWKKRIQLEKDRWFTLVADQWTEEVKVGAYVVNIKNIAKRKQGALLALLLSKTASGSASRHVWEFPVIEAVISYHWQTWAYTYLLFQLILFAAWTAAFVFYLLFYIEYNIKEILDGAEDNPHVLRFTSLLNTICLALMCPFAYTEFLALKKQKGRWFQARNAIDMSVIFLQVFFFVCHFKHFGLGEEWYSALLTFHTVWMFIKLLDYGRVLGLGTDFCEAFLYVIYDVRYFILFIVTCVLGAALCFATLYRGDTGFESKRHHEFSSVHHSMVTAFSIMFGQFEVNYVFDADKPWVKGSFFFLFQMLMTVTTLNLLIAVMTQSYSKFVEDQGIRYNISRASVIDELQVIRIPYLFNHNLDPFIHFLVVERSDENPHMFPVRHDVQQSNSVDELKKEVANLTKALQVSTH